MLERYIYASYGHVPDLIVRRDGERIRLITDTLGSVRAAIDADTGAVLQRLSYDAYGRFTQNTSPGLQPFGYKGAISDPVAEGAGLVWMGVRAYTPRLARFTTADPVGLAAGWNEHDALAGDPVNLIDADGLFFSRNEIADASAGAGDALLSTFCAFQCNPGSWLRDQLGIDDKVDECSPAYNGFNTVTSAAAPIPGPGKLKGISKSCRRGRGCCSGREAASEPQPARCWATRSLRPSEARRGHSPKPAASSHNLSPGPADREANAGVRLRYARGHEDHPGSSPRAQVSGRSESEPGSSHQRSRGHQLALRLPVKSPLTTVFSEFPLTEWGERIARGHYRREREPCAMHGALFEIADRHPLEPADLQRREIARAVGLWCSGTSAANLFLFVYDAAWQRDGGAYRRLAADRLAKRVRDRYGLSPAMESLSFAGYEDQVRCGVVLRLDPSELEAAVSVAEDRTGLVFSRSAPPSADLLLKRLLPGPPDAEIREVSPLEWAASHAEDKAHTLFAGRLTDHTGRWVIVVGPRPTDEERAARAGAAPRAYGPPPTPAQTDRTAAPNPGATARSRNIRARDTRDDGLHHIYPDGRRGPGSEIPE